MNFYLYSTIFIFSSFLIFIIIKIISLKKFFTTSKFKYGINININKRIVELQKTLNENPNDYSSLLELAMLEDKTGNGINALIHYEKLIEEGYFTSNSNDAYNIFKRIEEKYTKEDNRIEMLKYNVKLLKMAPSHIEYAIKIATILGIEGQHLLASQYFDKILHSRADLTIEQLKVAIFSFYKVKDFKKVSIFLEELYKKLCNSDEENIINDDINKISMTLTSTYLAANNYSQAKYLIDKLLVDKNISSEDKLYLDRLLLFTLYKLNNNYNFINFYHTFLNIYDMKRNTSLAFDYGFYSYFLNKISHSIDFFKLVIISKDESYSEYDIPTIIKYLSEIKLAFTENYYHHEKHINQEYISHWENVVELWEASLMNFNYLDNIIEINKTIDTIDKQLFDELSSSIYTDTNTDKDSNIDYTKLDSIYNMSIYEFKDLATIIIDKLGYVLIDDYVGTKKESFKDEFNYIAHYKDGNKKDTTLISFKRWSNDKIGELVLRDFGILIKECNAKNGILFIPTELTNSAKSYARHRDNIIVYAREQYNNLLKYL